MRLFPESSAARPETNRGGLRDILLDALAARGNTEVHYERGAWGCRRLPRGLGRLGAGGAELLDREGKSLGEFDLVIDAMGLHSPLARRRRHVSRRRAALRERREAARRTEEVSITGPAYA